MRVLVALLVASTAGAAPQTRTGDDRLSFDPQAVYKIPLGRSPSVGPADAPVTIVAWSDYACGYCNRVQDTLDRLARLYPGQLRFVHRTLPLDDDNTIAAEAALAAAAQGRFLPMHARMFALHGRVDRAEVELIARELGLDMIRFRAELDTGAEKPALAADIADARAIGVTGTPTFFVNGRPVHGAQSLRVFATIVDEELARAAPVAATHPADLYAALVASGRPAADAPPETMNEITQLDANGDYRVGLGLPGHQLGPDTAPVTIVEWSDFQCPYCQRAAPVLAHVQQKYGDQVRIVYRHYALRFHRDAMLAAEAGVAAAEQGKFWPFHDQVFIHFGQLTRTDLEGFAQTIGLDMVRFRAALDDRRYHDAVVAEGAAGEALGVDGTPTLFINGTPVVGMRDIATFDKLVDIHLDIARTAIARGLPPTDVYALVMSMARGDERADPSTIPSSRAIHIEMRPDDRGRAVAAACRRHDRARALQLAAPLAGEPKQRAAAVCTGEGIDLP